MSVGGLHDEAELRGHRRTYIGAMAGRLIQALRRAGSKNPVLMLDEVDKLGRDFRGDPASALLEVLDPAQNSTFRDNYLDLPFDLSKVMFITTANTLDTLPQPLLDRMEVIRLAGYSEEEKIAIANKYLIPRQLKEAGLSDQEVVFGDDGLRKLIGSYTREAGLRNLERGIGRLARKSTLRIAEGKDTRIELTPERIVDLLGPEVFLPEESLKELPPGVATGLAWTPTGGDVLYIEGTLLPKGIEHLATEVFTDMHAGLEGADVVMMLRLQHERASGRMIPSVREYYRFYGLDAEKLARAKPDAIVMHPGPMNRGVEIDPAIADGSRSVITDQVEMGVAVRMAVLDALARNLPNGSGA